MVQLKLSAGNFNIVQVYTPTAEKQDVEFEEFYSKLNEVVKLVQNSDNTIIL